MNKTQLIDQAAKETGLTKKAVTEAYDALVAAASNALAAGDGVQIVGFGTFAVRERAARTARNPRTNKMVQVPACRRVAFNASKVLKEKVNG